MTRMHQGRTLQSFRRLGTDILTQASPNNVEREARTRLVDRYNQIKKEFFQGFYKDWAAESKSRKEKLKIYEQQMSKAHVELQLAAQKLSDKNEKIMKLLVKTRQFFDPTGDHYRDYSRFYNIVKSLNHIIEKAEELTTKKQDVTALILAVRRSERLAGKTLEISDNGKSWAKLKIRLRFHLFLVYDMKITKIRAGYSWALERLWIEQKNALNEKIKHLTTNKESIIGISSKEDELIKLQNLKDQLVLKRDTMHLTRKFFKNKLENLKKIDLRMIKWAKEYVKRIIIEAIKKKEKSGGEFQRFKENSRKLHDYQQELIELQDDFDKHQAQLFNAQTRLQTIKQNVEWEYALAKDTEQLLEEELELFYNLAINLDSLEKGSRLFANEENRVDAENYTNLEHSFNFFKNKYHPNPGSTSKMNPQERLDERVKIIRKRLRQVKVIAQTDSHIDDLLARLFVNVQFLEGGMQCFSVAELSYVIFKLIKVNAIIDDKAFLTRFTNEMYDREPRRALEFAMFNYSALLGSKFLAKQNTAFFYKMGMPKWNQTIDEKMLTYFVQNYGILMNLHKDLTKFGISTQGQKPKHDDYLKFAKKAFFRLADTVADAYINYSIAAKIEQNFPERIYKDDIQATSGVSQAMQDDIKTRLDADIKRLYTDLNKTPTSTQISEMEQDIYMSELRKNATSFRDRWSPKLGMQIWKSRTDFASKLAMGLKLLLFALSCVPDAGIIINVVAKFFLKEYKTEINKFGDKMSDKVNALFEKVKKKLKRAVKYRHLRTIDAFGVDIQAEYALIDPSDIFFMKDLISLGSKAIADPKVTDDEEQDPDHFEKKMQEALLSTPDFQGMRVFREDFVTLGLIELSNEDFMDSLKKVITQNVQRETMAEKMEKVLPGFYDTFLEESDIAQKGFEDQGNMSISSLSTSMSIRRSENLSRRYSADSFSVLVGSQSTLELPDDKILKNRKPLDEDKDQPFKKPSVVKPAFTQESRSDPTYEGSLGRAKIQQFQFLTKVFAGDISNNSESEMFGGRDHMGDIKMTKNIFDLDQDPKVSEIYLENKEKLPPNWRPTAVTFLKKMLAKVRKDQVRQIKMDKYNNLDEKTPETQDSSEKQEETSNKLTREEYMRVIRFRSRIDNQTLALEDEDPKNLMEQKPLEATDDGLIEAYYVSDSQRDNDIISPGSEIIEHVEVHPLDLAAGKDSELQEDENQSVQMLSPTTPDRLKIYIENKRNSDEKIDLEHDSLSSLSKQDSVINEYANNMAQRQNLQNVESYRLREIRDSDTSSIGSQTPKNVVPKSERYLRSDDFELTTVEDQDRDLSKIKPDLPIRKQSKRIISKVVI